jgi:uncharacterized protein (TIGR03083 family)
MKTETARVWETVHGERARLVADLDGLSDRQWSTPSLCPGWTVHDVLAHLVDTAKTSRISFVRRMIAARFDFDGDNAVGVAREKRDDPAATLQAMRAVIPLTLTPPAAWATRLVEAFVHGEDIRRPLGIASQYPRDEVVDALRYQARASAAVGGGRDRVQGLRLAATDNDCVLGAGAEVTGRAIDLLLAVSGRPVDIDVFGGPGAARLAGPPNI